MYKYSRTCMNCGCVASWGNTHEGFYCEDCYAAKLKEPSVCVCCGEPATQTVNCEPNCDRCATKLLAPETLLRKCSGCKRMHTDCNDIDGQILCPDCADEWVEICKERDDEALGRERAICNDGIEVCDRCGRDGQLKHGLCPSCSAQHFAESGGYPEPDEIGGWLNEPRLSDCEACKKVRPCDFNGERCSVLS